jgi:hypothetical protein
MKKIIEINSNIKNLLLLLTRKELIEIAKQLNLDNKGFKSMIAKRIFDSLNKKMG